MLAYVERVTTAMAATAANINNIQSTTMALLPSIGWTKDGTGLVVRDKVQLINTVLPNFFVGQAKFSSFVRKLYRWGFQKSHPGGHIDDSESNATGARVVLFDNINFQRDQLWLLGNMRSITAPKIQLEPSSSVSARGSRRRRKSKPAPETESSATSKKQHLSNYIKETLLQHEIVWQS